MDEGYSIALDGSGNAYVTGWTFSNNYDVTAGTFQANNEGASDIFVTKLNATGSSLLYSTYIGGSDDDFGRSIAVDGSGYVYVTGNTSSTNYDVTAGAFHTTHGGGYFDVFVTKLCPGQNMGLTLSSATGTENQTVCINNPITDITYATTGATGATFSGLPPGVTGNFSGSNITIIGTPTVNGTFNFTLTLTGGCGNAITAGTITVNLCTGIEEEDEKALWKLYPNPSTRIFTIQTKQGGVFELIDISGKVLDVYTVKNKTETIQVSLPAGVYFIREKQSGVVQKLIIE